MLCMDSSIHSVVNIRLPLKNYQFKPRHRKLLRRNDTKFSSRIGKVVINAEKEKLYQAHKNRFKGFIHATLREYLDASKGSTVFDTREVCIYSNSKLVAVSYIDLGSKSVASLLCLFDQEYTSASLGIYAMLKEIEFCMEMGYKLYYPGYILDNQVVFNYKLSLGVMEYYNANKRWALLNLDAIKTSPASNYKKSMAQIGTSLESAGIEFKPWIYPYFSMGYMGYWNVDFLKYPLVYEISYGYDGSPQLLLAYDNDLKKFMLMTSQIAHSHQHLINMEVSSEFNTEANYLLHLLKVSNLLCRTSSSKQMTLVLQGIVNKAPQGLSQSSLYLLESSEV